MDRWLDKIDLKMSHAEFEIIKQGFGRLKGDNVGVIDILPEYYQKNKTLFLQVQITDKKMMTYSIDDFVPKEINIWFFDLVLTMLRVSIYVDGEPTRPDKNQLENVVIFFPKDGGVGRSEVKNFKYFKYIIDYSRPKEPRLDILQKPIISDSIPFH